MRNWLAAKTYLQMLGLLMGVTFNALAEDRFECSPPITLEDCRAMATVIQDYIRPYRAKLPKDWSWWVIPDQKWRAAVGRAANLTNLAVTDPIDRVTVLNLGLFKRNRREMLEFALAHEASHIICRFNRLQEDETNRAARRLMAKQTEICS